MCANCWAGPRSSETANHYGDRTAQTYATSEVCLVDETVETSSAIGDRREMRSRIYFTPTHSSHD